MMIRPTTPAERAAARKVDERKRNERRRAFLMARRLRREQETA